jgi:hypothetical protein
MEGEGTGDPNSPFAELGWTGGDQGEFVNVSPPSYQDPMYFFVDINTYLMGNGTFSLRDVDREARF